MPLAVQFNAGDSSDPDGDALSYAWDLDGDGQYDDSTAAAPLFTYFNEGSYLAGLQVTDPSGARATDRVAITAGDTPPNATISSPTPGLAWKVGDLISFSGSASDQEEGSIPSSRLSWTLLLNHCPSNCHTHVVQSWNGVSSGSFAAPDHEYPSHLELRLTARDNDGLTDTRSVRLDPRTVTVQMRSVPSGLSLAVNSSADTTPFSVSTIQGSTNTITASLTQTLAGATYDFGSWSDGGIRSHAITPNAPGTYTATYNRR